jgi:hypothetical protein
MSLFVIQNIVPFLNTTDLDYFLNALGLNTSEHSCICYFIPTQPNRSIILYKNGSFYTHHLYGISDGLAIGNNLSKNFYLQTDITISVDHLHHLLNFNSHAGLHAFQFDDETMSSDTFYFRSYKICFRLMKPTLTERSNKPLLAISLESSDRNLDIVKATILGQETNFSMRAGSRIGGGFWSDLMVVEDSINLKDALLMIVEVSDLWI